MKCRSDSVKKVNVNLHFIINSTVNRGGGGGGGGGHCTQQGEPRNLDEQPVQKKADNVAKCREHIKHQARSKYAVVLELSVFKLQR